MQLTGARAVAIAATATWGITAEVETASKGARCFRLDDVPVVKPHFLHPIHAWRSFTGQPWYNYMLIAWILTAVQKYFS